MAFVYFKCDCEKSLAVVISAAGRQVQCFGCGKSTVVPLPELYWTCACGEDMAAPKNLAGASVRCAVCEAEHTIPIRLELKRGLQQQNELQADVPRVPVGRTNDIRCRQCGYISPSILARCPQCQHFLRKGAVIRRQCLSTARVLFIIGLGWFLASHFSRISEYMKGLFGIATTQWISPVGSNPSSGNIIHPSAAGEPSGQ